MAKRKRKNSKQYKRAQETRQNQQNKKLVAKNQSFFRDAATGFMIRQLLEPSNDFGYWKV